MKRTVHYICFGVDERTSGRLAFFPSAQPKIQYIINVLKEKDYFVNVVSTCSIQDKGIFKAKQYELDNHEKRIYFSSFKTSLKYLDKISTLLSFVQLIKYILFSVKKDDVIIIYHSIYYYRPMKLVKKMSKKKFILEIEELYSYLDRDNIGFRNQEIDFINSASAYLLVNKLIDEKISRGEKNAIISHGAYNVPPKFNNSSFKYKDYINVVYAGVIENTRNAAFISTEAAKFLSNEYRVHILGFGDLENVENLKKLINQINTELMSERVIYHGSMSGNEYHSFLQACDIALSTHSYDQESMSSADYSFPSKIITYMANGLRVVSANIRSVKSSLVGEYLTYYDNNTPEDIAKAIMTINKEAGGRDIDTRKIIEELDGEFKNEIDELLKRF